MTFSRVLVLGLSMSAVALVATPYARAQCDYEQSSCPDYPAGSGDLPPLETGDDGVIPEVGYTRGATDRQPMLHWTRPTTNCQIMLIRFTGNSLDRSSQHEDIYIRAAQLRLTVGRAYEAQAISVYDGIAFALVYQDDGMASFAPRSLFEMVDSEVPDDWICNMFPLGEVQLVIGPDIVAADLDAYSAVADQEAQRLEQLWQRRHVRGPGRRFARKQFESVSPEMAVGLACALSMRLTATLDRNRIRESVPLLVEGLRALGHDLWNIAELQDEDRLPWEPTFESASGDGLRVIFDSDGVTAKWLPPRTS